MTSSDAKQSRRTARIAASCGLAAIFLGVLLVIAAGVVDRQLKVTLDPGFLPEDMPLYLHSADLPQCWLALARTPLAGNLRDEAPAVLRRMELAVRQLTGIRPTPARWRTWLGASMVAGTDGSDWIVCAHPGLAARAASRLFGGRALPGTGLHQAWRGGFLLLSSSTLLVDKALSARPVSLDLPEGAPPDTLTAVLRSPFRTVLTLTPSGALPVELRLDPPGDFAPGTTGAWPPPVLPGTPAALLSVRNAQCARQLMAILTNANLAPLSTGIVGTVLARWGLNHPAYFMAESGSVGNPTSCAFYDLSTDSGLPLPRLAMATSAQEDLSRLLPPFPAGNKPLPYLWNGCAGWMYPLLGDQFSLYGFRRDGIDYLATQESLAAMIAAAPAPSPPVMDGDVVMTLDWKGTAAAVTETAAWATAHELVPETNEKDLDETFMPIMRALSKCGSLRIRGDWTAKTFICRGTLASNPRTADAL